MPNPSYKLISAPCSENQNTCTQYENFHWWYHFRIGCNPQLVNANRARSSSSRTYLPQDFVFRVQILTILILHSRI